MGRVVMRSILVFSVVVISGLALTACGGGSSSGSTPSSSTSVFTMGAITAKGSVVVNGIEFEIPNTAVIVMDDNTNKTVDDLKVGMVVRVTGTFDPSTNKGEAQRIEFNDLLCGKIDDNGVDLVNKDIKIFGQMVKIDDNTKFAGVDDLSGLHSGDVVQVSGFQTNSGSIRATFIEKEIEVQVEDIEVKGIVSGFTAGGSTFILTPMNSSQPITVTLGAGVTLPGNFGNGALVEVKTNDSGTSITAIEVQVEEEMQPVEDQKIRIEGFVTDFSPSGFVVNGMTVDPNGLSLAGVANGVKVEVEGQLNNGILVAQKIEVQVQVEPEPEPEPGHGGGGNGGGGGNDGGGHH